MLEKCYIHAIRQDTTLHIPFLYAQKTAECSDVFRGYGNGLLDLNGSTV